MRFFTKTFLLAAVLGGITLFAVGATTGDNAFSNVYTYLIFVILIFALARMRPFKEELSNRKSKKLQFITSSIISFTIGFFGLYAVLFYYISREISNISLF